MAYSTFKHEYCKKIMQYVGDEGNSVKAFAVEIDVSYDTISYWSKTIPEFAEALNKAKAASERYWENWLKQNMGNKNINSPLVKLYFANRFGWTDKQEIKQELHADIKISEEAAEIKQIRESYIKDI